MKKLKFRAWSRKWKTMVYPNDKVYSITVGNDDIHTIWKGFADDEAVPVMFFIGLKDKHNVEIYEGDILEFKDDESKSWKIGEVKWRGDMYFWGLDNILFDEVSHMKVIGNLYENPKLLEDMIKK